MLLVRGLGLRYVGALIPGTRVEDLVAQVLESAAVEGSTAGFGLDFHGTGAVAAILRAIVGSEDLKLGNGFRVGVNVQRGIAAVVHVGSSREWPECIFRAATVHAVSNVAVDAYRTLVLAGLVYDARREINELSEIATVQNQLIDLLAGNGAGKIRRRGFHLSHTLAGDDDFLSDGADGELHVDAGLFGNVQNDFLRGEFLKALSGHSEVVGVAGQGGEHVSAVSVRGGGAREAASGICDHHVSAADGGAGFVGHGSADVASVLCVRSERKTERKQDRAQQHAGGSKKGLSMMQRIRVSHHGKTSEIFEIGERKRREGTTNAAKAVTPETGACGKLFIGHRSPTTRRPQETHRMYLLKRVNTAMFGLCQEVNSRQGRNSGK